MTRTDRNVVRLPARAGALALALVLVLAAVPGCNRRTQLMPAGSDSTTAADPSMVRLRDAQGLWESGGSNEDAAAKTADALWGEIKDLPPTEWKQRSNELLDSLGIGYESADGACALIVNFFARSDPNAGSWPYLFVCNRKVQPVEGRNLRLIGLITRGLDPGASAAAPTAGVAALFGRRAGSGQQPVLLVWGTKQQGNWDLVQTLGPDSLGGTGTGEFETPADSTVEVVTRTYRTPAFFQECATCPHFYKIHRFRWGPAGFARSVPDILVPSPYATFVLFIQALTVNDRDAAGALVGDDYNIDKALKLDWGKPRGEWRVAPAASERSDQITFFRGDREAYKVFFRPRGDGWEIDGFEETSRQVE